MILLARRSKLIAGKYVLLVDDVFTTGLTFQLVHGVESGAEDVFVLTIAQA